MPAKFLEERLGWAGGMHEVTTAILDRRTCTYCWDRDGRMEPVSPQMSTVRAPFHGRCRCLMITIFIPETHARRLDGAQIDYTELKADIREYMRSAQIPVSTGIRHAHGYIADTLKTSSPEALTRRLMNQRGYFPGKAKSGRAPKTEK